MQDYILAGLVFLFFIVFMYKTQSFFAPGPQSPCTPSPPPSGKMCQTNAAGIPHMTAKACPSNYPNASPTGCNNQNYCCQ